jgi:hypothetical protein
VPGSVCPGALV